jgi:hypothetical protein
MLWYCSGGLQAGMWLHDLMCWLGGHASTGLLRARSTISWQKALHTPDLQYYAHAWWLLLLLDALLQAISSAQPGSPVIKFNTTLAPGWMLAQEIGETAGAKAALDALNMYQLPALQ